MKAITKKQVDKATVCADKTCVTVYGEAAQLLQGIILCTVLIISVSYIVKTIR